MLPENRSGYLEGLECRLNYGARIGCEISWLHQEEEAGRGIRTNKMAGVSAWCVCVTVPLTSKIFSTG